MGHSIEFIHTDRAKPCVVAGALARKTILMTNLKIQLWRNPANDSWSVEINDKHYDFITFEMVQQLVAQALSDSKKSLVKREINKTH